MKQKYKVFINDQEILFVSLGNEKNSLHIPLVFKNSPTDIYKFVAGKPLSEKNIYVIESSNPEKTFKEFIKDFKLIEAAGGVVSRENKEVEILMIHRLGKWDLPKGKIDSGETPEAAGLREVEEECGISGLKIQNKITKTFHIYEQHNKIILKLTHWYLMTTTDKRVPVPQTNEGIEEVRWVKKSDLPLLLPKSYGSISSLISEYVLNG